MGWVSMETKSMTKYGGTLNLVDYLTNLDTTHTYHVSEVTVNLKSIFYLVFEF